MWEANRAEVEATSAISASVSLRSNLLMDEIDLRSRKRLEWNVVNFIVSGTPALIETSDVCWPTSIPEWKSKRA